VVRGSREPGVAAAVALGLGVQVGSGADNERGVTTFGLPAALQASVFPLAPGLTVPRRS
jgi:hypothetical protein